MKVLMVVDDFAVEYAFELAKNIFAEFGLEIVAVTSAYMAAELLKNDPDAYGAVFLGPDYDVVADGTMFLTKIKDIDLKKPVILISENEDGYKFLFNKQWHGARICQGFISKSDLRDPRKHKKIAYILNKVRRREYKVGL